MKKLKTLGLFSVVFTLGTVAGSYIEHELIKLRAKKIINGEDETVNRMIQEEIENLWNDLEPILEKEVNRRLEEA